MRIVWAVCFFVAVLSPVFVFAEDKNAAQEENTIQDDQTKTKLPIPRFASLKVNSINVRTGPGERYPIEWVVKRRALPVEIVAEYDIWRRIKMPDNTEGWVHQTMLSGRRTAIVQKQKEKIFLRANPEEEARQIAEIKSGAMGAIDKCENNWCRINFGRYGGWIKQNSLWGVYSDEIIK